MKRKHYGRNKWVGPIGPEYLKGEDRIEELSDILHTLKFHTYERTLEGMRASNEITEEEFNTLVLDFPTTKEFKHNDTRYFWEQQHTARLDVIRAPTKPLVLLEKEGVVYEYHTSFCMEHSLGRSNIARVVCGKAKSCKGFTLASDSITVRYTPASLKATKLTATPPWEE